jgi:hypothetical protein
MNIYLKLQQPRRGGKSWRSANDEKEEEKKLAPNLNCGEEEERASSVAASVRVAERAESWRTQ